MTLSEYKALKRGATLRMLDEMERSAMASMNTARAGMFGKDSKPVVKELKDLFDREKVEKDLLNEMSGKKKVNPETVENFKQSKERAEAVMNGLSFGNWEEDENGE